MKSYIPTSFLTKNPYTNKVMEYIAKQENLPEIDTMITTNQVSRGSGSGERQHRHPHLGATWDYDASRHTNWKMNTSKKHGTKFCKYKQTSLTFQFKMASPPSFCRP
jgi:hypothetical protein